MMMYQIKGFPKDNANNTFVFATHKNKESLNWDLVNVFIPSKAINDSCYWWVEEIED